MLFVMPSSSPSSTSDPCSPSTPGLLQRAKAGDTAAFQTLYECYARPLFTFFLGYTADARLAEELVNDTFMRVWQALPRYREEGHFRAWLFRIARNLAADQYRRNKHCPEEVPFRSDEHSNFQEPPAQAALNNLAWQEQLEDVHTALQCLRPDYRTVLLLRFIEGLSVRETAQIMHRSEGAVRVLQLRALKALRKHLSK